MESNTQQETRVIENMNTKMALLSAILASLLLISFAVPVFGADDTDPTQPIESQPTEGITVLRQLFANWRFSTQLIASTSDLWIGHWDAMSEAVEARQIRPDFKAFLYANIKETWDYGANDPPNKFNTFLNNGWFLKDAGGYYVKMVAHNAYVNDIGNPAVQQWFADWIKGYLETYGLDGAFLDNCVPPKGDYFYGVRPAPINPRTGVKWTRDDVTNAIIALVNKVKDTITPKIVLGNAIFSGNHFFSYRQPYYEALLLNSKIDGIMSEGWISNGGSSDWYTEDSWKKGIDLAVWIEDNLLSLGNKLFITVSENAGLHKAPLPDGSYPTNLPSGVTREQYVTYCFASRLLAVRHDGNYMNFGFYMPQDYPQSLFKIDLGSPLDAYYMVSGTHVYARDFSKVKVLVNPSYDSYSVELGGEYETLDGVEVTSPVNVQPHTGLILVRGGEYTLKIHSSPTGVTFDVDGVSRATPWSGTYIEGTSVSLIMPEIVTVGDARYLWNQWSDGYTSRSRTVTITTNITLTAVYAQYVTLLEGLGERYFGSYGNLEV